MLLHLDDHALVADLCNHYRRSGFTAEPVGGGMIEIQRLDAPNHEQGNREILMHLHVWKALNPDVEVTVEAE